MRAVQEMSCFLTRVFFVWLLFIYLFSSINKMPIFGVPVLIQYCNAKYCDTVLYQCFLSHPFCETKRSMQIKRQERINPDHPLVQLTLFLRARPSSFFRCLPLVCTVLWVLAGWNWNFPRHGLLCLTCVCCLSQPCFSASFTRCL